MNLTFLGLCIACMGVSVGEGLLMIGLFKSVARQPDMLSEFRSLMFLGVAFIEGTFFVTLVFSFIIK
uniref:ATP synthase subunit c n=1 Tax=Streptococcus pneumoniae TaxID=1313 RepID=Q8KQS5_STREE|nr:F0F1 H+-ATPase C subunit [Streptococcus pneumoniae]